MLAALHTLAIFKVCRFYICLITLLPGNYQKQLANSTSCSSWIYQINHLSGQMPRSLGLSSCSGGAALSYLSIEGNKFNGIIPYNLGQFSGMYRLDLSSNSLEGDITEAHFSQLLQLGKLGHILQLLQIGFPLLMLHLLT